jgi:hypothetical protein
MVPGGTPGGAGTIGWLTVGGGQTPGGGIGRLLSMPGWLPGRPWSGIPGEPGGRP